MLAATFLLFTLASCGIKTRVRALFGGDIQVRTNIAANANMNNPIAVEFVLVYEEELLNTLVKTTSKDWFLNREQIRKDFPEGFRSWYWEWTPGQDVDNQKLPLVPKAKAALLFANYVAGESRIRLDPHKSVVIDLGERAITATQE